MTKEYKCSVSQIGRIVIHKEDREKRIYSNELEKYMLEGWEKGLSQKHIKNNSNAHKGKVSTKKGTVLSDDIKNRISNTLKNKYTSNELTTWNKGLTKETDERVLNYSNKSVNTRIEKFGSASPNYNKHLSEEHKQKIGKTNSIKRKGHRLSKDKLEIKVTKQYLTRKKHNSFNTSKPEEEFYNMLLEENKTKTIYRNYKDNKRYPFYCDFYIKEDDLFIELNKHWTHGSKPFDPNDNFCQEQLELWKEKAKTSQFYKNAIETWTIRDVEKQRIAKENNLNYKAIY